MTMTPTATGYRLTPNGSEMVVAHDGSWLTVSPRPAHRALMTAETARANLETKAGLRPQPEPGAHYVATFEPAALLAEYQARTGQIRDPR